MRTVGPRLAAGLFAASLLVSGCGGNPEPQPLPKPTVSPSPSASASATPPVMPSAAKAKTKAGAIEFARYYVELINHAQATGDTVALAGLESPECKTCARSRKGIERLYESGAVVRGGDWSIGGISAIRNPATDGWLVELAVRFGPQFIDRPGSADDQDLKGGRLPVNLQLEWRDSSWQVGESTRGA